MKDDDRNVYIFSHSKLDILIGKYFKIIVIAGWITLLILETFWGAVNFSNFKIRFPVVSIELILPLFFILSLLLYLSLHKFVYQVIFDFNDEVITLFLYNKKNPISFRFNELKTIKINWFIFFICNYSAEEFQFV